MPRDCGDHSPDPTLVRPFGWPPCQTLTPRKRHLIWVRSSHFANWWDRVTLRKRDRKTTGRIITMVNEKLPISYGNEFAKCFYLKEAPSVLLKPMSRSQLAITRLTLKNGLPEPTAKVIPERAFTIAVHLYRPACRGWGTWVDGKFLPVESWMEGGV